MLVAVDCFPVSGICCSGHVHTGSSVGFTRKLPCKATSVQLLCRQVTVTETFIVACFFVGICIFSMQRA